MSKAKGNRGELAICKMLNARFDTNQFGRVPSSGAISTLRKGALSLEAEKTLSGDLFSPTGFVFSLEIKTGYSLEFNYLFNEKNSADYKMIKGFCEQCCRDASRVEGRIPMVIYTKDRRDPVCLMPMNDHDKSNQLKENLKNKLNIYMNIEFDVNENNRWNEWIMAPLWQILKIEDSFFFGGDIEIGKKTTD